MDVQTINEEIYDVWVNHPNNHNNLAPNFINSIHTNTLLFVGLNPAFNVKWIGNSLRANNQNETDPLKFFRWNKSQDKKTLINRLLNIDSVKPSKLYRYYFKFKSIADLLNEKWSDIDLFHYRETNQNKLKEKVLIGHKLNDFGLAQFQIAGKLIKLSQPKVIIFSNALSSNIFRNNFKLAGFDSLTFDENKGFHWLRFKNKKIPTFFSGMLTGQRALDLGSLERLIWHIKQSLKAYDN